MIFLIKTAYLLGSLTIGLYLYFWSGPFKVVGESTMDELNNDGFDQDKLLDKSDVRQVKQIGNVLFIVLGFLIWAYLGTTVGKIASDLSDNNFLRWLAYFFMYFIFLRFPFAVVTKILKKIYELRAQGETTFFAITMIAFYVWAIVNYDTIPYLFKWHLVFLN